MQDATLLDTLRLVSTELNQRALSKRLGFSVGKTNYILKSLVEKGLLKIERFAHSQNKLNYRYVLTPKGISERISLTECFIERKRQEYQQLSQELESLKVSQQQEQSSWLTHCSLNFFRILIFPCHYPLSNKSNKVKATT